MKTGNEVHQMIWHGIEIEVQWAPQYMGSYPIAHLQVFSKDKSPLPITGTGYRSHFCLAEEVTGEGGPLAYVLKWLEQDAVNADWKKYEKEKRAPRLFNC